MSDPFERDLRRLMAETALAPADDAFVHRVSVEIARRRRRLGIWRAVIAATLFVTALTAAPSLAAGVESAARLAGHVAMPVFAALATPAGWTMSGLMAIWLVIRTSGVPAGRP